MRGSLLFGRRSPRACALSPLLEAVGADVTVARYRSSTWNSLHTLGPVRRCALLLRGADRHDDGGYTLRCVWCGRAVGHDVEIDHIVARCDGGTDELSNLVPSCPGCNYYDPERTLPKHVQEQAERPITLALRREAIAFACGFYPWFKEWSDKNRAAQRRRDERRRERKHRANVAKLTLVREHRRKEEHVPASAPRQPARQTQSGDV